jgi:predicted  nucleic acid-binding Zn-ribbon protein
MHQCMQCNKKYEDSDRSILVGCNCGSKLFLYVKENLNVFNGNGNTWHMEARTNGNGHVKAEIPTGPIDAVEKTPKPERKVHRRLVHRRPKPKLDVVRIRSGVYKVNLDALMNPSFGKD